MKHNTAGSRSAPIASLWLLLLVATLAAFGCDGSSGGSDEVFGTTRTQVMFEMTLTGADWNVYLDGGFIARLDSDGEQVTVDATPGTHQVSFHDNRNNRNSLPIGITVVEGYLHSYDIGVPDVDGVPIRWI